MTRLGRAAAARRAAGVPGMRRAAGRVGDARDREIRLGGGASRRLRPLTVAKISTVVVAESDQIGRPLRDNPSHNADSALPVHGGFAVVERYRTASSEPFLVCHLSRVGLVYGSRFGADREVRYPRWCVPACVADGSAGLAGSCLANSDTPALDSQSR